MSQFTSFRVLSSGHRGSCPRWTCRGSPGGSLESWQPQTPGCGCALWPLDVTCHRGFLAYSSCLGNVERKTGFSPAQLPTRCVTWGKSLHLSGLFPRLWLRSASFQVTILILTHISHPQRGRDSLSKAAVSWPQSHCPGLFPS